MRIVAEEPNYPQSMVQALGFRGAIWLWLRMVFTPQRVLRATWTNTSRRLIARIEGG